MILRDEQQKRIGVWARIAERGNEAAFLMYYIYVNVGKANMKSSMV